MYHLETRQTTRQANICNDKPCLKGLNPDLPGIMSAYRVAYHCSKKLIVPTPDKDGQQQAEVSWDHSAPWTEAALTVALLQVEVKTQAAGLRQSVSQTVSQVVNGHTLLPPPHLDKLHRHGIKESNFMNIQSLRPGRLTRGERSTEVLSCVFHKSSFHRTELDSLSRG
ncbi:unnamed protein product [Pleuronectes platessa]|uniref:Uncharacterized protein n=1 Tax=Pleuronectes platessa TaxID=8262 RepID=A0A9N7U8Q2_PLEPL|nr:unnamed protein product [Pleuronectes platessa]